MDLSGLSSSALNGENTEKKAFESSPSRFHVNRIDSIAAGCHPNAPIQEQKNPALPPYVTSYPFQGNKKSSPSSSVDTAELLAQEEELQKNRINGSGRKFSKNLSVIPFDATKMSQPPTRRFSLANILGRKKSSNLPDLEDFSQTDCTVGVYGKTLSRCTMDALPKMDNYMDVKASKAVLRPTLEELHGDLARRKSTFPGGEDSEEPESSQVKFGWIEGCLVRCLLNIWGVMLFLRLSWMVAQAGIIQSLIIIVISTCVTTITTLSMSAVSTNGEIKGGGIYYMISRSLGPEWGGAIGVVFSFANSGMAALNIVGFSESMISLLSVNGVKIIDGGQNDNRIISCIAVVVLQSIIVIGMEWEAKAQVGLLMILLVAMGDFVLGAFMGPQSDLEFAKGYIGLNGTVLYNNLAAGYRHSEGTDQDFFSVFSIFFPAVAGIQAGASISGDLKDPGEAIPKGTLLAIFITSASYAAFAILAGAGTLREATGNVTDIDNWDFANCTGKDCKWGLYNDYQVMELMSLFGPIIYAGCFAATLSSALSCLVSGPKTFQALGKDKVYPGLTKFGIGYGKSDDPYWSYAIGFVVALIFILIADLNAIAPLISNFFMAAYALLNFSAFHAAFVNPTGWRPTFKYFNMWVCLIGAILCLVVMIMMSWVTAIVSIVCTILLYVWVIIRHPDVNWGTSSQAQTFSNALSALQSLTEQEEHVKNYCPQILCLTGEPWCRPALVDFANLVTKDRSLLMCGNIVLTKQSPQLRRTTIQQGTDWLSRRKVKGFFVMVDNCRFDSGAETLLQATGIGRLAPNILLMGFKHDWQTCSRQALQDYFTAIHEALDNYMALSILRLEGGIDISYLMGPGAVGNLEKSNELNSSQQSLGYDNKGMDHDPTDPSSKIPGSHKASNEESSKLKFGKKRNKSADDLNSTGVYRGPDGSEIPKDIVPSLSLFRGSKGKGVIDVWWLYDDGGLTLLLPYIIQQRHDWSSCKLRVFALSNKVEQMEQELLSMSNLLKKFRIDVADLDIIPDITKRADATSRAFFDSLIKDFRGDPENSVNPETVIGEMELMTMKEKTNRHLRLRELLLEKSKDSNLIFMTLPVPRKGRVSAPLYLAWLETLTRGMPPFVLVRGNQTSVLTFYS